MAVFPIIVLFAFALGLLVGGMFSLRPREQRSSGRGECTPYYDKNFSPKHKCLSKMGKPVGVWECTHSKFEDFKVGERYEARPDRPSGFSIRIYPSENSNWAPFWERHNGRFCYPAKSLEFKYIGPLPASKTEEWLKWHEEFGHL